jgi:hypothetical protein
MAKPLDLAWLDGIQGDRLFVVAYKKPEKAGTIFIPESERVDTSWVFWEVLKGSRLWNLRSGYDYDNGEEIQEGDIIYTFGGHTGVDTGQYLSEDDRRDVRAFSSEETLMVIPRSSWTDD